MPEMGRKLQEKSSFALTCNLLSQYIKEKGAGGLGIARAPPAAADAAARAIGPPTTISLLPGMVDLCGAERKDDESSRKDVRSMDLFPQSAGFGSSAPANVRAPMSEKAQLTIFYGGKVMVFDDFPAEKAKDLMQMASNNEGGSTATATAAAAVTGNQLNGGSPVSSLPPQPSPSCKETMFSNLRRKQSLHRFFEKRKDRIQSKSPYQGTAVKVKKEQEESPSWLGLGPGLRFE